MSAVRGLVNLLATVFACFCVATVTMQAISLSLLASNGGLQSEKLKRYAAIAYGLDVTQIPAAEGGAEEAAVEELLTREQIIKQRVSRSQLLKDREKALREGASDVKLLYEHVREENMRFEEMKRKFDDFLEKEERAQRAEAIQEVEQTLSVLNPRQSKELILRMLQDRNADPDDDVMGDLVTIIETMPQAKLKKIMSEFKTPNEAEKLNEILRAIGKLDFGNTN